MNIEFAKSKKLVFLLFILSIYAIGYANYLSGRELNLFVLFIIPCMLAAWHLGIVFAIVGVAMSIAIAFITDITLMPEREIWILSANAVVRLAVFCLVVVLVWKIKSLTKALKDLSLKDTLSDIGNKRALMLLGEDEIGKMRRTALPFSVAFIDLDNFKEVNDSYGHNEGDAIIREVGVILREKLRASDFPARIGGDEFAILLYATDGIGAKKIAEEIRFALGETFRRQGYNITLSIGIATFLTPPDSFENALGHADSLMYKIKNSSKNGILQENFL